MRAGQVPPRILVLWSLPRSRSTAFFRMMAERGDFLALHEPFSNLAEFGRIEVGGHQVSSQPALLGAIRQVARAGPVFIKDTTDERYPDMLADADFLARDATHTFLIRHPLDTIASYHSLNPGVQRHQIGVAALHEIFRRVTTATGRVPVVIDAADLMAAPAALVSGYCAAVSIGFRPEALRWSPGHRQEWYRTQRWHLRASASSGFEETSSGPRADVLRHPVLSGYLRYHLPFYEDLHAHRLRP